MLTNVGTIDRLLRIVIGLVLVGYAIYGNGSYAYAGWIGIIPIATALFGWCPLYQVLGVSTCGRTV